jgi:hypothetical protein
MVHAGRAQRHRGHRGATEPEDILLPHRLAYDALRRRFMQESDKRWRVATQPGPVGSDDSRRRAWSQTNTWSSLEELGRC